MGRGVRLSFIILSLVLFIGIVSAYTSFSLIKEDRDSRKAVLIYALNPSEVIKDYNTIIQMNYLEGDFLDLALYLKNSKITRVVYYQQENLPDELLNVLRNEAGVNLVKIANNSPINKIDYTKDDSNEILLTGKSIEEQQSRNNSIFILLSLGIIATLAILLIFMPKKKKRN